MKSRTKLGQRPGRKAPSAKQTKTQVVVVSPPAPKSAKKKTKPKTKSEEKSSGNLGSRIGGKIGSFLGGIAQKLLTSIIGEGDYSEVGGLPFDIRHNTLMGTPVSHQIPIMSNIGNATRISHREYVGDITMTDTFYNAYMRFSPTNATMFPWLFSVAENFEQYKFLGMVFEFRSLAANAVAATVAGMGSISLATQYNVYEPVYNTKTQANNAQFATSCKPSESMFHPIECDPQETPNQPLYISHPYDTFGDARFNEMGTINIVTQGAPAVYSGAGELWVTYDILLLKPIVPYSNLPLAPGSQPLKRNDRSPPIGLIQTMSDGTLAKFSFESLAEMNKHIARSKARPETRDGEYVRL